MRIIDDDQNLNSPVGEPVDFSQTLYFNDSSEKIFFLMLLAGVFSIGCGLILINNDNQNVYATRDIIVGYLGVGFFSTCFILMIFGHWRNGFPSVVVNIEGVIYTRFSKHLIPWSIVTGIDSLQMRERSILMDGDGLKAIDIAYPKKYDRDMQLNRVFAFMQPANRLWMKGCAIPTNLLIVPHDRLLYVIRAYYFEARRRFDEGDGIADRTATPET